MSTTSFRPNTTCDVYRQSHGPPSAPDVAGVAIFLEEKFENIKPDNGFVYTHLAHFALGVDIRDTDTLYIPDKSCTQFSIVLVTRRGWGSAFDHKVAYLKRVVGTTVVAWPTDYL